jgi:hypothetical protein
MDNSQQIMRPNAQETTENEKEFSEKALSPPKLSTADYGEYHTWKSSFQNFLLFQGLESTLTYTVDERMGFDETATEASLQKFIRQDAKVRYYLQQATDQRIRVQISNCSSAKEAYSIVCAAFDINISGLVTQLDAAWAAASLKPDMSNFDTFIAEISALVTKRVGCGVVVTEQDEINKIMSCIPREYRDLRTRFGGPELDYSKVSRAAIIRGVKTELGYDEMQAKNEKQEEQRMLYSKQNTMFTNIDHTQQMPKQNNGFYSQSNRQNYYYKPNRFRDRENSSSQYSTSFPNSESQALRPRCTLCGRKNHKTDDCFYREGGKFNQQTEKSMLAATKRDEKDQNPRILY